jgi:hypothetical protein
VGVEPPQFVTPRSRGGAGLPLVSLGLLMVWLISPVVWLLVTGLVSPEVTTWCDHNDVELVFIPTHASWLNWVEAELAALRYVALNGTDHRSHTEQGQAIGAYIRWRNANTGPKRGFAMKSKIRSSGWQANYRAKVSC